MRFVHRAMHPVIAASLLTAGIGPSAAAEPGPVVRPGATERVSVGPEGIEADSYSIVPVISGNGRFVAFTSDASNLVPGDTNDEWDVFVHDRLTGRTERASVSSDGGDADGISSDPEISADGRFVVFTSDATNLVAGDTNADHDVFVRDLVEDVTELASVGNEGQAAIGGANDPAISADGRYVGFSSSASNLVPDDTNGWGDAFVRDRQAGTTVRVSVATGGVEADLGGGDPALSPDGGHVAFTSIATNLDGLDASVGGDVYLRDLSEDRTTRVSVAHDGGPANEQSAVPDVSDSGRFVAFRSAASNLVPGDRNTIPDFFVRDTLLDRTERVSVSSAGAAGEGVWYGIPAPEITADGRHVAFSTISPGLVAGDENENLDVFVHDRLVGSTEMVTIGASGAQAHGTKASISDDGRHVSFLSDHAGIAPGDTNDENDVFVRDRGPVLGVGAARASRAGSATEVEGWATVSGAVVASAVDPAGDATAEAVGTDLIGATVAYRPHTDDLLVRWPTTAMASTPGVVVPIAGPNVLGTFPAAPAVYALSFSVGGTAFEVRGQAAGAAGGMPAAPAFALYRCEDACEEVGPLEGGLGDAGIGVSAAVPLGLLANGAPVEAIQAASASTRAGTILAPGEPLDEVVLGTATLPLPSVAVALGGDEEPPPEAFRPAATTPGLRSFRATFAGSGGEARIWTRVCLGTDCRTSSFPAAAG